MEGGNRNGEGITTLIKWMSCRPFINIQEGNKQGAGCPIYPASTSYLVEVVANPGF